MLNFKVHNKLSEDEIGAYLASFPSNTPPQYFFFPSDKKESE
jgi:hypothetical protein